MADATAFAYPPGPAVPPPLALYVHVPWCLAKCPYCDFNSHPLRGKLPEAAYLDAIGRDLEMSLPAIAGRPIESVFIGGGTPSLLSVGAVARLLETVHDRLPLRPDAEITLEANPGASEAARFRGYRAAGVNRISIGVQSFDDAHLAALGRVHDGKAARRAVEAACACFDAVNIDMLYALPGQTLAGLEADLAAALDFAPAHLSLYHLTLEPNTAYAAHPPPLPDDDCAAQMQAYIEARLAAAGYAQYEVSAYARPGARCRHNLNYWQFGDYLGLGAGAHSKLSHPNGIKREARLRHPRAYLRQAGRPQAVTQARWLDAADRVFEFMMNALRLTAGVPARLFQERTGLPLAAAVPGVRAAVRDGLLEPVRARIVPTARGRRYLNDLLLRFLP